MARRNYYADLELDPKASAEEIKTKFRKLALKHHPDTTGGESHAFRFFKEAYETLGNSKKRRNYDRSMFGTGRGGDPRGWETRRQAGKAGVPNPRGQDSEPIDFANIPTEGFAEERIVREHAPRWYAGQTGLDGHQGYYSRRGQKAFGGGKRAAAIPKPRSGGGMTGAIATLTAVLLWVWGYKTWMRMHSKRE
jgi:DnaJ-class molecular chaperone